MYNALTPEVYPCVWKPREERTRISGKRNAIFVRCLRAFFSTTLTAVGNVRKIISTNANWWWWWEGVGKYVTIENDEHIAGRLRPGWTKLLKKKKMPMLKELVWNKYHKTVLSCRDAIRIFWSRRAIRKMSAVNYNFIAIQCGIYFTQCKIQSSTKVFIGIMT